MKPTVRACVATLFVAAFAVSTGCDKPKENSPTSKPAGPAASVAAATGAAAPIALSDDDVPVAEDFIEEATKEIDKDNLSAKLDDIEKEIGAE